MNSFFSLVIPGSGFCMCLYVSVKSFSKVFVFCSGMVFNVNVGFAGVATGKDDKECALFLGDTAMVNEVSQWLHFTCMHSIGICQRIAREIH